MIDLLRCRKGNGQDHLPDHVLYSHVKLEYGIIIQTDQAMIG